MKRIFSLSELTHGSGPVFLTWQKRVANYIVTTGIDNTVLIHDKYGGNVDIINLPGNCTGLSWDYEGDILGVITDKSPLLILWDASNHRITRLDTGVREPLTLLIWSKKNRLLAIGTCKGNLLIYNHLISRKVPISGKHSKSIVSGSWNHQNLLAILSEDHLLTVSNEEGELICSTSLKGEPSLVHFGIRIASNSVTEENCVSVVLNKKSLFLIDIKDPDKPFLLTFAERYGCIVDYQWFSTGSILVGFSIGLLVVVSTDPKQIGQEIISIKSHPESLHHFATCEKAKKLATCSENVIKFYDYNDLEDVKSVLTVDDERAIEWMEWTDDGQMIAMAASSSSVHVYLTKLNILGACYGTKIAYLSSLLEVTVLNVSDDLSESLILRINIGPSLIAVGPYHVAVSMNNRAWFYSLTEIDSQLLIKEKEYSAIIKHIKLNGDYVAALFTTGKLHLHLIENESNSEDENREVKIFNDGSMGDSSKITTIALTNDFLIYGTDNGSVEFFSLEDWSMVNIYRHPREIKLLAPDNAGLRIVFIDNRQESFVYNAVNDSTIAIPSNLINVKKIFWESSLLDKGVFIMSDDKILHLYSYTSDTINGQDVCFIDSIKIPTGQYPLMIYNGLIICQTESGKTCDFILKTHDFMEDINNHTKLREHYLPDLLKLRRYMDVWKICEYLNNIKCWRDFAKFVLKDLNIELALKIYRHIGDAGMVYSLELISHIEERNLLAGYIALYLEDYTLAQKLFLSSSKPIEALEMRQNLHDWDSALLLAKRLSPKLIPFICCVYANQCEFQGNYTLALDHFEKALNELDDDWHFDKIENHIQQCKAGIARNSIRCGNIKRGVKMALSLDDSKLHLECGEILESLKLYSDAATLYEKGNNFEKAAESYLKVKNINKVNELINEKGIETSSLLKEYASMAEIKGNNKEAVQAFLRANDNLNAIRILLDKINNPSEAIAIVKESKSLEGAKLVAKFFQKINDMSSAIEFLVISKCNQEAFELASANGQMDIYAKVLLEQEANNNSYLGENYIKPIDDYKSLAIYFEQNRIYLMAGRFYCLSGNVKKGVKLLIQSAMSNQNENEAITLAIEALAKDRDEQTIHYLIDYLIGEIDGIPRDFKYLFRLYMALGQYKEAAKTALIIAREEQNIGNYRNAHQVLFRMYEQLKANKIKPSLELENNLMLVHSYLLGKAWIKIGDHLKSAQLLIRVSNNINKFQSHIVPILTSTVIECQRTGFKKHAFQFASTLMKPEYRNSIDPKYRRKLESFVRKSAVIRESETLESSIALLTPCPFCDNELMETELICFTCRNTIPFCIATGYHVISNDLTRCPSCLFPAIYTQLIRFLEKIPNCPMCEKPIDPSSLDKIQDFSSIILDDK